MIKQKRWQTTKEKKIPVNYLTLKKIMKKKGFLAEEYMVCLQPQHALHPKSDSLTNNQ